MYQNMTLYAEDLIANALVAKAEIQSVRTINEQELEEYAKTCRHICRTRHNVDVRYELDHFSVNQALERYSEFLMRHEDGSFGIRPKISTTDVKRKFRPYLSVDMIRCYVDAGECFRPGNLETEHMVLNKTDGVDWMEQSATYMLLTKDGRIEFYDVSNRPHAKGLLKNLVPGSELYCITISGGKPMPLVVTDGQGLIRKLKEIAGN